MIQNLWDAAKAVLRGKFIAIQSHLKKQEKSQVNNLTLHLKQLERGASRWWRSKMWRSPSSPQIHQKYIYVWNNSYRTPTKHWQKTSDLPKGKKLPTYLGRVKEKRKNKYKE